MGAEAERKTVRVIATFVARRDRVNELEAVLAELVEPTRAEAGCLRYELWQNEAEPTEFRFVEEWVSEEALAAHLRTPHITRARARYPEHLAAELELAKYRQAG